MLEFFMDVITVAVGVHVYFVIKNWRETRRYR